MHFQFCCASKSASIHSLHIQCVHIFTTYKRFFSFFACIKLKPSLIFKQHKNWQNIFCFIFYLLSTGKFHSSVHDVFYFMRFIFLATCRVARRFDAFQLSSHVLWKHTEASNDRHCARENKLHYLCYDVLRTRASKVVLTSVPAHVRVNQNDWSQIRDVVDAISK